MRLNKYQIEHLSFNIVKGLISEKLLIIENKDRFLIEMREIITRELSREDELDEMVKDILRDKLEEIRNSNIDYFEMFKMVKAKLAKRENIIL